MTMYTSLQKLSVNLIALAILGSNLLAQNYSNKLLPTRNGKLEEPKWLSYSSHTPSNKFNINLNNYIEGNLAVGDNTILKDVSIGNINSYSANVPVPVSGNPDKCITFYPNGTYSWDSGTVGEIVDGFKTIFKQ